VLLGVTGSVAAVRVPALVAALQPQHEVRVVTTTAARYFFAPAALAVPVYADADEWPGVRYERGDPVLHIELRRWAEVLLIAPLDANTLAKLALGLCDNCLTCVYRAWALPAPVVLAPAMNTLMWQHPATRRHLRTLADDAGVVDVPAGAEAHELCDRINARAGWLRVVPPIRKTLACGDVGDGALAEVPTLVEQVERML
jgi:phosphopantothenoylcysteine decarboxylase